MQHNTIALPIDPMHYLGEIIIRQTPAHWNEDEWKFWWLPELYMSGSKKGQIKRPSRLTPMEKDSFSAVKIKNIVTTAGRNQILTFIGNAGSTSAFSQYFAVGSFPVNSVQPGDTAVNGEYYRAAPSLATINGNSVDLSNFFGTGQANGTITNCGLFGINATSSTGSGTLMTHALINNYVKTSASTVTFDYIITLS